MSDALKDALIKSAKQLDREAKKKAKLEKYKQKQEQKSLKTDGECSEVSAAFL